jgi:hypothetical protein
MCVSTFQFQGAVKSYQLKYFDFLFENDPHYSPQALVGSVWEYQLL